MKRNRLYFLVAMALLASGHATAQQYHTTIEVLHPGIYHISQQAPRILLVNNTVEQPRDYAHRNRQDETDMENVGVDLRKASTTCMFASTKVLEEGNLFRRMSLLEKSQNTSGNFFTKHILSQAQCDSICKRYEVDAILALNQIVVYDIEDSYLTNDGDYYVALEAYATSQWTVQYNNSKAIEVYTMADTLYWENRANVRQQAIAGLPNRQEALLYLCEHLGARFANNFLPTWEKVDRYFYENDDWHIESGITAFAARNWDKAIEEWEKAYADTDLTTRAYAAANLALVKEIVGEIEQAMDWTDNAVLSFTKMGTSAARQQATNLRYYRSQLAERLSEESILNK